MYTPKTFTTLVTVTNLAWKIGVIHFHYVKSGRAKNSEYFLETNFSSSKLNLVRVTFLVNALYVLFIAVRAFSTPPVGDSSLGFLIKMGYLFTAYALPVVIQYNTVLNFRETPLFLSQYLPFFKKIREKYLLPDKKGAKCRKFFSVFIAVGVAINIQNVVILILKPFQPHLFTSLLKDPKKASIILRLPMWLVHFYNWASLWANLWVYCFHWFTYISCSLFLIKDLDVHVRNARTSKHLREPTTCLKIIRSMQVLHRLWEISFQYWLCPAHKAVVCTVATLALYGAFKLPGPRAVIMGLVSFVALLYLSTLFYKFGQLYESSKKVIRNWNNFPGATKWLRKVTLSIPELGIKIGSFYCVNRTTVVNVLWIVLNNTITLFFI